MGRDEGAVRLGESDDLVVQLLRAVDGEGHTVPLLVERDDGEHLVAQLVGNERTTKHGFGRDDHVITHGVLPELRDGRLDYLLLLVPRLGQPVGVDLRVRQAVKQLAVFGDLPRLGRRGVTEEAQARPIVGRVGLPFGVRDFHGLRRDVETDRRQHLEGVTSLIRVVVDLEEGRTRPLHVDPDLPIRRLAGGTTLELELRPSAPKRLEGEDVVEVISEMRENHAVVVDDLDDAGKGQVLLCFHGKNLILWLFPVENQPVLRHSL